METAARRECDGPFKEGTSSEWSNMECPSCEREDVYTMSVACMSCLNGWIATHGYRCFNGNNRYLIELKLMRIFFNGVVFNVVIGYYSNDFALGEFRNNSTVRIKNEQRGLHLNNLSYMGPIIMGVGGECVL